MSYDDLENKSPEDERERLDRFFGLRRSKYEDSPEADAYWDAKIDQARER